MDIKKATLRAKKSGTWMARRAWGGMVAVLPVDSVDCYRIASKAAEGYGRRWNPDPEDILANDWYLTRAKWCPMG